MNTLLIGITATIIIFKVQNGLTKTQEKDFWDSEKVIDWLKKNCTYIHPRKGTEECFINLFALKDAMEAEL